MRIAIFLSILVAGSAHAAILNKTIPPYINGSGQVSGDIVSTNANGPRIENAASTNTNPVFVPDQASPNTGIGGVSNSVTMVAAGTNVWSCSTASCVNQVSIAMDHKLVYRVSSVTCADNGAGTAAACTDSNADVRNTSFVTCNDANGCTLTLDETSASNGQPLQVVNVSANTVTLADTAGVQETGATALGQWDGATFIYVTDRWVQTGTNNN